VNRHRLARRRAESIITALLNGDEHLASTLVRRDPDPHQLAWAALRMLAHTFAAIVTTRGEDPAGEWRKHLLASHARQDG